MALLVTDCPINRERFVFFGTVRPEKEISQILDSCPPAKIDGPLTVIPASAFLAYWLAQFLLRGAKNYCCPAICLTIRMARSLKVDDLTLRALSIRAEAAHAGNGIELWAVADKACAAYYDALKVARQKFRAFPTTF